MDAQHYCEYCGSTLEPDSVFCENCGNRVKKPVSVPAPPAATPPPPRPQPVPAIAPSPPVDEKPGKSRLIPIIGIGCAVLICIGVLSIGGYFYLQSRSSSPPEIAEPPQATTIPEVPAEPPIENPPEQATSIPEAEPTEAAPPEPAPPVEEEPPTDAPPPEPTVDINDGLTGNQRRDETSFFDDFSSKALGWPEYDDGLTIIKYENEVYSIQIAEPGYYDWAYAPVDFLPNSIWFDAWGLPGQQDGAFGVMCQYQDMDNYYYVEIDLGTAQFMIVKKQAGELIPLTTLNDVGQYWQDAPSLNSSPDQVNSIGLDCYLDLIILVINDNLAYTEYISEPFTTPGEIALYVQTFSFAGPEGYKVFFDNVHVQRYEE